MSTKDYTHVASESVEGLNTVETTITVDNGFECNDTTETSQKLKMSKKILAVVCALLCCMIIVIVIVQIVNANSTYADRTCGPCTFTDDTIDYKDSIVCGMITYFCVFCVMTIPTIPMD
eukprot:376560_1